MLAAALVGVTLAQHVTSIGRSDSACMLTTVIHVREFLSISVGIAALLIAMAVEWFEIYNHVRIERMPLADIERLHPRLPPKIEIIISGILTASLLLLFIQFIATVYAMSFTLSSTTTEVKDTMDTVMGDFDGDGDIDYIAGDFDAGGVYKLDLYKNDGTGVFTNSTFGTSVNFKEMAAGDIDGDGDLDLVATNGNNIYKYTNDGTATFTQSTVASPGTAVQHLLLSDVDNNGTLDIVVSSSSAAIATAVYLNSGTGVFSAAASTLPAAASMVAADFNSDGYLDLAIAVPGTSPVLVYANSGTGAFVQLSSTSLGANSNNHLSAADIDGDGDIDIILSQNTIPAVVGFNNGLGTSFTSGGPYGSVTNALSTAIGDLDNDGDMDFIIGGCDIGSNGGGEVMMNGGVGTFSQLAPPTQGADCVTRISIGDIDGDGDLDYIRGNKDYSGGGAGQANRHYKSDQAATSANTAPTAPTVATLTGTLISPSPKNPTLGADDSSIGTVTWSSATNIYSSDNVYAGASFTVPSGISHYLKATGFGFTVPTSATILGIKVEVEKKQGVGVIDYAARIIKAGTIGTTDRSAAGSWPIADAITTYGSGADLWGTTWTPAQINASDFGFAIAAQDAGAGGASAFVDHIRITVYYNQATLRLSWGSGSDTQSATKMLQYQLQVGTGSNSNSFYSSKTASPYWTSRLMPNGQSRTVLLRNLPCGNTFYWSVAAVDTGFKSTRSSEQTFTLSAGCGLGGGVGGGGGGSTTTSTTPSGGGSLWRIPHEVIPPRVLSGHLLVSAFEDINGNGRKDLREKNGFAGLSVTASGSTASGVTVRKTLTLSQAGEGVFELEQSDSRGYTLIVDTGSSVLAHFNPTSTLSGSYRVTGGSMESVAFAFRRVALLDYKPCLTVAGPLPDEKVAPDSLLLLGRLEDAFSHRVTDGVDLKEGLLPRIDFLKLLARTECVSVSSPPQAFSSRGATMTLIDLPMVPPSTEATLLYSLLAAHLPAARETPRGLAADLSSPITRREAIHLLAAAMNIPQDKRVNGGSLPSDLSRTDSLTSDFLTLESLGVLPSHYLRVLSPEQGIIASEAATLLARAAFQAGHISLLPIVLDKSSRDQSEDDTENAQNFLSDFPLLPARECLLRDPHRPEQVTFTDLLPGDSFESSLRSLLMRGTINSDGKTLWLLTGTQRPTEFGITKGNAKINLDEPVSLFEALRTLLVLRCLPPLGAKGALLSVSESIEGSREARVPRDRLSALPRDLSFVSRVFYRAQDHERTFDLSLFTFAPQLLLGETRKPDSVLNIEDGSALLASALLNLAVHETLFTPQEAEEKETDLAFALARDFLSRDNLDWRSSSILRTTPLTRRMLLTYLSAILDHEVVTKDSPPKDEVPSLGEVWWERLK